VDRPHARLIQQSIQLRILVKAYANQASLEKGSLKRAPGPHSIHKRFRFRSRRKAQHPFPGNLITHTGLRCADVNRNMRRRIFGRQPYAASPARHR
jgi:hypothetical protein